MNWLKNLFKKKEPIKVVYAMIKKPKKGEVVLINLNGISKEEVNKFKKKWKKLMESEQYVFTNAKLKLMKVNKKTKVKK